jgi:NitT/TauT family transport system ATP-binding protein
MSAIEINSVTRVFGSRRALEPVDLSISSGEFVAILGPSGCGKTTLLRIIAGLDQPSTGTITIDNLSPAAASRKKHCALIAQQPALLPWRTVRQNITLLGDVNRKGGRISVVAVQQWLMATRLSDVADQLPHTLSGGMRQRVAMARAMALGAPVLLADEPFSNLDEITRDEVRLALSDMWELSKPTVVFITHSLSEAVLLADRVIVMSGSPGRIVDDRRIDLPRPRTSDLEDDDRTHHHIAALRHSLRSFAR